MQNVPILPRFCTAQLITRPILFLNHDFDYETDGSVWQSLVSDPRFGSALASAIDKEDVNQNLYFGLYTLDGFTKENFDADASNANSLTRLA